MIMRKKKNFLLMKIDGNFTMAHATRRFTSHTSETISNITMNTPHKLIVGCPPMTWPTIMIYTLFDAGLFVGLSLWLFIIHFHFLCKEKFRSF